MPPTFLGPEVRTWKNRRTGELESRTTWHKCVAFGRTAEYASSLTEGAHLQIVGEIQTRKHTAKDGSKKSVTEIRVRLDRASNAESTEGAAAYPPTPRFGCLTSSFLPIWTLALA
jgi:single-stranded DNA-binding protein